MASASEPIVIDGSTLEGGGQILRNSVAFSCLTRKPIKITKIRAGRKQPGLRPQHLTGIQLISAVSGGTLQNAAQNSTEISFYPGESKGGTFTGDTKTAGSVALMLQATLPCLLLTGATESTLILKGGTNADMAPPIDYFTMVMMPIVERLGVKFDIDIVRRGYYPKGGGELRVGIPPVKSISPIDLTTRGEIVKFHCRSYVAGVLPLVIAQEMATAAEEVLHSHYPSVPVEIEAVQEVSAIGNGCGLSLSASTSSSCILGSDKLGKRGVPAAEVGREAAETLIKELSHGGCVDEHLQDQLIVFMALANGVSRVRVGEVSLHTQTAIWVAEKLTDAKFTTTRQPDGTNIIECHGIGLENPNSDAKLESVFSRDWYTQKVEAPKVGIPKVEVPKLASTSEGKGDGRKRIKSDDSEKMKDKQELDSDAAKLKSVFEASAW